MQTFIFTTAIALLLATSAPSHARNPLGRPLPRPTLRTDLGNEAAPQKSPKTAFLLSFLVPGLGEYYASAKLRAAGFFIAEATAWFAWSRWRSEGSDLRDEFRAFADVNFNEAQYRQWQAFNASLPPSQQYVETETLPTRQEDEQQYYELIGKYAQFVYGWSDVADLPLSVNNQQISSPIQIQYEVLRNDSNQPLKRASVVIGITVVNHIASAIHASAYTRLRYRKDVRQVSLNFHPVSPSGDSGVTAVLTAGF